ncbi:signal peptide peptidase SppA [Hellea balneolensis]|uniref:signal peptide peptidase SppA n=1 Tax=Hellea balneolensis TaxID=287478 RepID=UPI000411266E|nr:signal peptide peptidase SppA [Hellea balneolensis]
MRQFFTVVFGTVVGIFAFFFVLIALFMVIGGIGGAMSSMKTKDSFVLSLDLRQGLRDHSAGESVFGSAPLSVVGTARALNHAKENPLVKGLFIRANQYGMAPASSEEIRLAIKDFKTSGKFVITHAQGFEGTSVMPYRAVAASDELWMQDTTGFAVAGLRSETEFYGGVFEKFGAKPEFEQFHEYKNAVNTYTQTDFTEAHRESVTSYMTSLYETAVSHISEDRSLSEDSVKSILLSSPHSAEDALAAKMVDKMGHVEEAREYARKKAGGDSIKLKSIKDYSTGNNFSGPTIAFIGGQGPVVTGGSADGSNPFIGGGVTMGGDTLAKAFDDAAKNKRVKAIIFRVSSPGGSPAASDQIHDAVARAQEAGKPVIISMGQYAASGGYYVAANADKIVALPGTITGSIGVYGGKLALEDTFAKVGYNIEGITIGGDYAGAFSADEPFNQGQRAAYRGQLEDIYDDFTNRVAEGRDMPLERVKEIAKGRVWTGTQAKEIGLVDELGGFMKAIGIAKEMADIDEDTTINLKRYPRVKTTSEQLAELFGGSAQVSADLAQLSEIIQIPEVQAAIKARNAARMGNELKADIAIVE